MADTLIIADENIHSKIILTLRKSRYTVFSIRESSPGISDSQVLSTAFEKSGLLLTEDSDFGELIFSPTRYWELSAP